MDLLTKRTRDRHKRQVVVTKNKDKELLRAIAALHCNSKVGVVGTSALMGTKSINNKFKCKVVGMKRDVLLRIRMDRDKDPLDSRKRRKKT